ncbi:hypothetical protein [Hyalangium sp.]|uniref:hypothetical protein n=1 Tax=Hyalangium sp. TaxID=2028555 RepID=UPI002D481EF1|nr:hypothetical protein [Hyalangium sp.]HYH98377.1 hypothetical protein [Hyalangium sp.]
MAMVLPLLVTGMVLAGSPAMRYSSQLRAETIIRTPNLTEREDRAVIEDVVITPRGQLIFYTPRMELKAILEPQLLFRRTFTEPTLEVLTFLFLRGEYQAVPGLKVWAMSSTTYGSFPFEDFRIPAPTSSGDVRLLDASKYVYSENMVGFDFTGIRRTYIGLMGGVVINGLLDPPTVIRPRADRVTPAQIGPEVRAQAFHSLTRRLVVGAELYGRDVHFSTQAHLSLLQASPLVQYQFHPLINGRLSLGLAVGERQPQRALFPLPTTGILHPIGEASITTPVPVGYHWPVKAKISVRYVPFVNAFTTYVIPRVEGGFGFEWVGRRKAQVNIDLALAQAATGGFHRRDGEERLSLKVQWPLTRSSAVVASGRLLRLREFLIDPDPIYKWFMGVGLVIRQENGRL